MNESNKTPFVIAFFVVVVHVLVFGCVAMTGSMIVGGLIGHGTIGGFHWMWIPTLFTLGLAAVLGWTIFRKSK